MLEQSFLSELKQRGMVELPNDYYLYRKKWTIWNHKSFEIKVCGSWEEAKLFDVGDGLTVEEYIKQSDVSIFEIEFEFDSDNSRWQLG